MKRQRREPEDPPEGDPKRLRLTLDDSGASCFLSKFSDAWNPWKHQVAINWELAKESDFATLLQLLSHASPVIVVKSLQCLGIVGRWLNLAQKNLAFQKASYEDLYAAAHDQVTQHMEGLLKLLERSESSLLVLQFLNQVPHVACSEQDLQKFANLLDSSDEALVTEACLFLSRPDLIQDPQRQKAILELCHTKLFRILEEQTGTFCPVLYALYRLMDLADFLDLFKKYSPDEQSLMKFEDFFLGNLKSCDASRSYVNQYQVLWPLSDLRGVQLFLKLTEENPHPLLSSFIMKALDTPFSIQRRGIESVPHVLSVYEDVDWLWRSIGLNDICPAYLGNCFKLLIATKMDKAANDRMKSRTLFLFNHVVSLLKSKDPIRCYDGVLSFVAALATLEDYAQLICESGVLSLLLQRTEKGSARAKLSHLRLFYSCALDKNNRKLLANNQTLVDFACNAMLKSDVAVESEALHVAAGLFPLIYADAPTTFIHPQKDALLERAKSLLSRGGSLVAKDAEFFGFIKLIEGEESEFWSKILASKEPTLLILFFDWALDSLSFEKVFSFSKTHAFEYLLDLCAGDDRPIMTRAVVTLQKFLSLVWENPTLSLDQADAVRARCVPCLLKISDNAKAPIYARVLVVASLSRMMLSKRTQIASRLFLEHEGFKIVSTLLRKPDVSVLLIPGLFQVLGGYYVNAEMPAKNQVVNLMSEKVVLHHLLVALEEDPMYTTWVLIQLLAENKRTIPLEAVVEKTVSMLKRDWTLYDAQNSPTWGSGADAYGETIPESLLRLLFNVDHMLLLRNGVIPLLAELLEKYRYCQKKVCLLIDSFRGTSVLLNTCRCSSDLLRVLSPLRNTDSCSSLWNLILKGPSAYQFNQNQRESLPLDHFQMLAYSSGLDSAWTSLAYLYSSDHMEAALRRDIQKNLLKLIEAVEPNQKKQFYRYLCALAAPIVYVIRASVANKKYEEPEFPRWVKGGATQFTDCSEMGFHNDVRHPQANQKSHFGPKK